MTEIKSINELLGMELDIPDYQRPYKWTIQNIEDLLSDISNSITDAEMYRTFKYRIGTIILHKNDNGRYKDNWVEVEKRYNLEIEVRW